VENIKKKWYKIVSSKSSIRSHSLVSIGCGGGTRSHTLTYSIPAHTHIRGARRKINLLPASYVTPMVLYAVLLITSIQLPPYSGRVIIYYIRYVHVKSTCHDVSYNLTEVSQTALYITATYYYNILINM